jgi:DNA-binding response OmpR family regulator
MATNSTLLCIHRDPAQLDLLRANGYELITATNGSDGLRLLMSRPVDAIVLEYYLGLLDGAVVATEIKKVRPQLPIVMLTENSELPESALKSVDALVTKSDGPHFLWATVHFVLSMKPAQRAGQLQRSGRLREGGKVRQADALRSATDGRDAPFSPRVWRKIRSGRVKF